MNRDDIPFGKILFCKTLEQTGYVIGKSPEMEKEFIGKFITVLDYDPYYQNAVRVRSKNHETYSIEVKDLEDPDNIKLTGKCETFTIHDTKKSKLFDENLLMI